MVGPGSASGANLVALQTRVAYAEKARTRRRDRRLRLRDEASDDLGRRRDVMHERGRLARERQEVVPAVGA
jgi:hypothetical protein